MKSTRRPPPADTTRRPSLRLALQTGAGVVELPASRAQLRRWILAALHHDAELTLRFVGRREARDLNAAHRSRDYAPDVLTFNFAGLPLASARTPSRRVPSIQADIVLCMPVLREQARSARMPLGWRLAHLVIHGTLHAQGYEHERDQDALVMQALETTALRRFGIPDPYAEN